MDENHRRPRPTADDAQRHLDGLDPGARDDSPRGGPAAVGVRVAPRQPRQAAC